MTLASVTMKPGEDVADEVSARERLEHPPVADPSLLRWLVASNLLPWLD
jgi:hypothetical protein